MPADPPLLYAGFIVQRLNDLPGPSVAEIRRLVTRAVQALGSEDRAFVIDGDIWTLSLGDEGYFRFEPMPAEAPEPTALPSSI